MWWLRYVMRWYTRTNHTWIMYHAWCGRDEVAIRVSYDARTRLSLVVAKAKTGTSRPRGVQSMFFFDAPLYKSVPSLTPTQLRVTLGSRCRACFVFLTHPCTNPTPTQLRVTLDRGRACFFSFFDAPLYKSHANTVTCNARADHVFFWRTRVQITPSQLRVIRSFLVHGR